MATARTTPPDPNASRGSESDPRVLDPRTLDGRAPNDRALIDARFRALLDTLRAHRPGDDVEIIRRAWEFSLEHHQGQVRASGEPYVLHPLEVAHVLAELKLESFAIAARLLHDAVGVTSVTAAE